jgi:hypothetical protein
VAGACVAGACVAAGAQALNTIAINMNMYSKVFLFNMVSPDSLLIDVKTESCKAILDIV